MQNIYVKYERDNLIKKNERDKSKNKIILIE